MRRSHYVAAVLAAFSQLDFPKPEREPNACRLCGSSSKAESGECSRCGVYQCRTCLKYHLGNPAAACNGLGVDIPSPEAR